MEEKLKSQYKDFEKVTKGTISILYKGTLQGSDKIYAIKFLKAETNALYEIFANEIQIQRQLSYSNIMPIYFHEHNKTALEAYYAMPYLRSLRNIISNRPTLPGIKDVIRLIRDSASALDYAERYETIAHNRLKPENIFFSEETHSYLLADWSGHLACRKNNSLKKQGQKPGFYKKNLPTSIYEAPEAMMPLEAASRDKMSSYKADIYSLGAVVLEFCGIDQEIIGGLNCAFTDEDFKLMHSNIRARLLNTYPFEKIIDAVMKLTNRWSYERPSASEVIIQMDHLFSRLVPKENNAAVMARDDDEGSRKKRNRDKSVGAGKGTAVPNEVKKRITLNHKNETKLGHNEESPEFLMKLNAERIIDIESWDLKENEEVDEEEGRIEGDLINTSIVKKTRAFKEEEVESQIEYDLKGLRNHLKFSPLLKNDEYTSNTKEETNYTSVPNGTGDKNIKSAETIFTTLEAQPNLKYQNTPDSLDETKEAGDPILVVRKELPETQAKSTLKRVPKEKEDPVKREIKFKKKKSGFVTMIDNFGDELGALTNRALRKFEGLNLFKSKTGPTIPELDRSNTSPVMENKFLSPRDRLLTSRQLQLPKFSYSDDPRRSLFSCGDFGDIEDEPDEVPEFDSKKSFEEEQRFSVTHTLEKSIQKVHVFSGPIVSTSWSPNGKYIVTGSLDHSVRIMDSVTGECIEDVGYVHQDPVLCVAWSPDGGNIVSGSDDGSLKVFNFQMSELHHSFDELYVGSVNSVSWSPDGTQIASASLSTIKIVDLYHKKLVHNFKNIHTDDINQIAWSKSGKFLASASADKTVKIIEVESKSIYHSFQLSEGKPTAIAWSRGSTTIAVGSSDQSLKVFDIMKKDLTCSFDEALGAITCVAWSNDGKYIASGSDDCIIRVYEYANKVLALTIEQHKSSILTLSWSPDSENLISASKDCKLLQHNVRRKAVVHTWVGGFENAVTALSWSWDKLNVAAGSAKGALHVYELLNMGSVFSIRNAHQGAIKCIAWSRDGKFLATGSQDCSLKLFFPQEQKEIWMISQLHQSDINTVDWTEDSKLLLTGSSDNSIKVIDVQTKEVLYHFLELHADSIRGVAWSNGSNKFVSCSNDWRVCITTIEPFNTEYLYSDIYWLSFVGFSNDGKSIISGSEGGTIKIYDVENKTLKREITTRPDIVDVIYGYSYAADAGVIAAISINPAIKIYHCETNNLLFDLEGSEQDRVCCLALSRDGKRMITGLQDGCMRVYNLSY